MRDPDHWRFRIPGKSHRFLEQKFYCFYLDVYGDLSILFTFLGKKRRLRFYGCIKWCCLLFSTRDIFIHLRPAACVWSVGSMAACLVPAVQGMTIFWHGVRSVLLSTNTFDTDGIVGRAVPSLEAAKSCRSLLKGMTRFPARRPPPVVGPCDREASSLHRFPGLFSWHFWRYASW